MEQDIQKQTAGPDSYYLWGRAGIVDKTFCVAVFFEEGATEPLDPAAVLHCARARDAVIHACYIKAINLAHYGQVDHLAPAGDMETFANYVAAQDMEQAREVFAALLAAEDVPCRLQVLYGSTSMVPCLQSLSTQKKQVQLFIHRK